LKYLIFIGLQLLILLDVSAQVPDSVEFLTGKVYDRYNERNVSYAHVVNQTNARGTISDSAGVFVLRASIGDTLFISAMGYQFDILHVRRISTDTSFMIEVVPRAYMLPEVVIHELNTYEKFKERFVEIQLDDGELIIPGIPHLKPRAIPKLQDTNYIRNPLFALNSPISFLYYNLSRKEKNKRKYNQLVELDRIREIAMRRIDTSMIIQVTGIDSLEVAEFIRYCDFQPMQVAVMNDYDLYQVIRRKYLEFRLQDE